jgi:hypothetical protein
MGVTSFVDIKDSVSVKQILLGSWDKYLLSNSVLDYQVKEVEKAMSCYGSSRGCFVYYCANCDNYIFMTMGCNGRLCSCCGKRYADQWSHSLSGAMFPVAHRHFVMSVPDALWPFLRDWNVLKVYMGAAVECFNDYFSKVLHRDVLVGVIVVLHPFGKDMKFQPHLHLLVTEGGFDRRNNFVPLIFIPADGFRKSWQFRVLKKLQFAGLSNELASRMYKKYPKGFYVWLHLRGRIKHPKVIGKYVGRYVRHPAIANSRIYFYDGNIVKFFYTNNEDKRVDVVMTVEQFITALIQHIPPPQFKMIRYYGAYARKAKGKYGAKTRSGITQLTLFSFGVEKMKYCPFCHNLLEFVWYCKKPPPETPKEQKELLNWISSTSR